MLDSVHTPGENSIEGNKAIVRNFYLALDAGNLDEAFALLTPDYLVHVPGSPAAQSRDEYLQTAADMYLAFPYLRHVVEDQLAEGDRVAVRLTASGTHRGPLTGAPATRGRISVVETAIFRLADNHIAEQWPQVDTFCMLQQLGAIPGAGERGNS